MKKTIKFIGLDVHKNSISIAIADEDRNSKVRYYGKIANTLTALDKFIKKQLLNGCELKFIYEAGPCGYSIYRHLTGNGFECMVAAPSLIPKKHGNRIKNDRRDSISLASLYRAGELTAVYVPKPEDEAMRDMVRARQDAVIALKRAKQSCLSFLLRHGLIFSGRSYWSRSHFRWIADLSMDFPNQQIALQEYVDTIHTCQERVKRFNQQITLSVQQWRLFPQVKALMALRGIALTVAVTTVAELGDIHSRFTCPSKLMAYLGLVPSEHSSGDSIRRGPITRAGNRQVRKALVEAAQAYRLKAKVSKVLAKRQQGLPASIIEISWNAQLRLCYRYRALMGRGKSKNKVVCAIARELAGFIWAIAGEVPHPVE